MSDNPIRDDLHQNLENATRDLTNRILEAHKAAGIPPPGEGSDDGKLSMSVILATLYSCKYALEVIGGDAFARAQMMTVALSSVLDEQQRNAVLEGKMAVEVEERHEEPGSTVKH